MKRALWIVAGIGLAGIGASAPAQARESKETPDVVIISPTGGATLAGIVTVLLEPADKETVLREVFVALDGPPFVPLKKTWTGNRWKRRIDSRLYPNGRIKLRVAATRKDGRRMDAELPVVVANPLRCFLGDIHSHTSYSDGTSLPIVAHAFARDRARLDFFILTDHLEYLTDAEWADIRTQAARFNQDDRFVTLCGLEWTKHKGHCNLLDPPGRHWPEDAAGLYQAAADAGIVVMINHPGDGSKVWNALVYSATGDRAVQLMEVRDDQEEQAYIRALRNGWHLAAAGTDDTHKPDWGTTYAWTGILAPGLSRANVWQALQSRHCYSTTDRNCRLDFRIGSAVMGDVVEQPVTEAIATVSVQDPDANDRLSRIELFEDGEVLHQIEPGTRGHEWELTLRPAPGKHFYFVKVTQADGQQLRSAPIWLTGP